VEQMLEFIMGYSGATQYVLVFVILLICGFGVPIPEDITLFVAGLLTYYSDGNVYLMIALCLTGVMLGDSIIFTLGSKYGGRLAKKWFFSKTLTPKRLDNVAQKLQRYGNKLIFAARFMPGLRAPIFFSAGTLHLPFRVFFFFDGLAALISVPTIVYSIYYFGDEVDKVIGVIKNIEHGIIAFILIVALFMLGKWYFGKRQLNRV
jgi:membrane protein DedA with SNARE-associated domain